MHIIIIIIMIILYFNTIKSWPALTFTGVYIFANANS